MSFRNQAALLYFNLMNTGTGNFCLYGLQTDLQKPYCHLITSLLDGTHVKVEKNAFSKHFM